MVYFTKMDLKWCGPEATKEHNLTSLEGPYTDFDQWVVHLKHIYSERLQRVQNTEEKKDLLHANGGKLNIHEFLIHGIFTQTTPMRNFDGKSRIHFSENDIFVNKDYVIFSVTKKNNYKTKSKL